MKQQDLYFVDFTARNPATQGLCQAKLKRRRSFNVRRRGFNVRRRGFNVRRRRFNVRRRSFNVRRRRFNSVSYLSTEGNGHSFAFPRIFSEG